MAEKYLLEEKVFSVRKDRFEGIGVLGGLDRGCTLTKVLFSTEKDADHYNLHFALFRNNEFEAGLDYLKQKGMVVQQPGAKLHVTGAGCDRHRDLIREKLGLEIQFIDEFLTQSRGTHWLLTNVDDSQLCYEDPKFEEGELPANLSENPMIRTFIDSWQRDVGELPEGKLPCLMLFIGSGAGILKIDENGMTDMVGGVWFAGRSLLGLAKLLLGTGDYDEIMRLAASGRRENIDLLVRDVLANQEASPYGSFPEEFPLFSFGKVADLDKQLPEFAREDVANSLVFSFLNNAFSNLMSVSRLLKIGRLYMGGNFFRHEFTRREIMKQLAMFAGPDDQKYMRVKFLKTGHTGAIGAMMSKPEDVEKYLAYMQQQQQQ